MKYSEKVKSAAVLVEAIKALKDSEYVVVTFGTDYEGNPKRYRIRCMEYSNPKFENTYSIHSDEWWNGDGMNIQEFTATTAKAYTFDLMRQKTTYTFPLYEMKLV